jgi:hypothetical protein
MEYRDRKSVLAGYRDRVERSGSELQRTVVAKPASEAALIRFLVESSKSGADRTTNRSRFTVIFAAARTAALAIRVFKLGLEI